MRGIFVSDRYNAVLSVFGRSVRTILAFAYG